MIKLLIPITSALMLAATALAQHPATETTTAPQSAEPVPPAAGSYGTGKIERKMEADRKPGLDGAAPNAQPGAATTGADTPRPDTLDPSAMHDERTPPPRQGGSAPSGAERPDDR